MLSYNETRVPKFFLIVLLTVDFFTVAIRFFVEQRSFFSCHHAIGFGSPLHALEFFLVLRHCCRFPSGEFSSSNTFFDSDGLIFCLSLTFGVAVWACT